MIRVILTPCSLVVAIGELHLVTVLCSGHAHSTWWWRDRKLGAATVGRA